MWAIVHVSGYGNIQAVPAIGQFQPHEHRIRVLRAYHDGHCFIRDRDQLCRDWVQHILQQANLRVAGEHVEDERVLRANANVYE